MFPYYLLPGNKPKPKKPSSYLPSYLTVYVKPDPKPAQAGRNIVLIHNHWNNSAASLADLGAADWLDAERLVVVTPSGERYYYHRRGGKLVALKPVQGPGAVAESDPVETAVARLLHMMQSAREAGNPAERVMRQDQSSAVIEVSGSFRAYGNQWYAADRRGESETFMEYDFTENPGTFRILARSTLNPSLVQIEVPYPSRYDVYRQWINLEDLDDKFRILGSDLEGIPIKYPLRSFVADQTLDIELIWEDTTWPDKSGVGVRSRDFNPLGSTQEFLLQSPTIGPDVRVEFVATDHAQLGNYVVISFPASVIQENETIMRRLSDDKINHDPSQWREDGRIFVAFAHLSDWEDWDLQRPQPGTYLDSPEKAIIGMTGNTGTVASHLDLSVVYYGSADNGTQQMAQALTDLRWDKTSVDAYFGLAQRSSLDDDPRLYGENLDPVRIWPELDEFEAAEYEKGESIYRWKN
ncbi:MAG: hypothetical protein OXN94_18000 [Chloroflexota bacterium]|nr:hypothetical protein [Chloroflexota bacterium]